MAERYGGLRKATIIIREDGLIDVVRERAENGESIRGCANLEEAFDAIRAHAFPRITDASSDAVTTEKG